MPNAGTEIYIADTMGELGLLYRLGTFAFIGKSLGAQGGQNPLEARAAGCRRAVRSVYGQFPRSL